MMRLLYLTQVDPSRPYTGSTRRIFDNLKFFSARHEVHLVYVETPKAELSAAIPKRLPDGLASAVGVERGGRGARYFNRKLYAAACKLVEERRIDVVIAEFGEAGVYGLALKARYALPFVYMSQNVESQLNVVGGPQSMTALAFGAFVAVIERACARMASLVTAVTAADAEVFRGWGGGARVRCLPTGFDADVFHPEGAKATKPDTIVFVGNLSYEPNREAVQFLGDQVIDHVLSRRPDVQFEIIGSHEPGLEKAAPRAKFVGFVEDLSACLRAARLIVVPVMSGGGMRMKTVEALACGKMVVAAGKGADGIDVRKVTRIKVVAAEDFAATILAELEGGRADDAVDYTHLWDNYSIQATLARFERDLIALTP